jgi:hypothetical protein
MHNASGRREAAVISSACAGMIVSLRAVTRLEVGRIPICWYFSESEDAPATGFRRRRGRRRNDG